MADASRLNSSTIVSVVGAGSTGVEQTPVQSTSAGALHTNFRDSVGAELGTQSNPIHTTGQSEIFSPLPSLRASGRSVIAADAVFYVTKAITSRTAMKEFHVGGRAACEGALAKYVAGTTELAPSGGFNSSGDVSAWVNTSNGSSASTPWAYSTAQFIAGTGSAAKTFTQSDNNNYPEITYNYPSATDLSKWRYLSASVRATVAAGGSQSRAVQVRITSGTAIRIWQIVGTTTTSPFNVEQWLTLQCELENPHAVAGTGVFDINNVNSISLRLIDGGNKAGTVYWDNVNFNGEMTLQDKIYTSGQTTQLVFDPVVIFEIGETLLLSVRNNSASSSEFQTSASGVDIT